MALPPAQPSQSEEEAQADVGELDMPLGATEADKQLELDENIRLLRSLVPASDLKCGRWSIDLARDVSQYIERIDDLRTEVQTYAFGNTSSRNEADCKCQNRQGSAQIQVNATRSEGGIKIYARCRKQPGVMEAAVDALEALDLDLVTASVKCCSCNHMILDAFGLQDCVLLLRHSRPKSLCSLKRWGVVSLEPFLIISWKGDACSILATQRHEGSQIFKAREMIAMLEDTRF